MKVIFTILIILNMSSVVRSQNLSDQIQVNQIGYPVNDAKCAWVTNINTTQSTTWYIKEASSGTIAFTGSITSAGSYDPSTEDNVLKLDFSSLTEEGIYFVEVENLGKSYDFVVSDTVYNNVFYHVMRSFYYQRSGMALEEEYAGQWYHPASFEEDAYVYDGYSGGAIIAGDFIPSVKGWFDAGDFGKKVTPAASALYHMLKLFEYFPERVNEVNLNIPADTEIVNLPHVLAEIKYELDWFFTMQRSDGAVYHLITTPDFHFAMPHTDTQTRYMVPPSSMATADFAAVMAQASIVYQEYDASYATKCLDAAELSWSYLDSHPDIFPTGGYTADPTGINNTGQYLDSDDSDERLWASAELYNATGDTIYKNYFDTHYSQWEPNTVVYAGGWLDVHNYAMYTYVFATLEDEENSVRDNIRQDILGYMNVIKNRADQTGYGLAMTHNDYYWSSNQVVLNYGSDLLLGYLLFDDNDYLALAQNHLNYVLGANSLNLSFTSGIGENHVKDILQACSPRDGIVEVIPGFVTGGPNQWPDTWDIPLQNYVSSNNITAPAKHFYDHSGSYSSNEVVLSVSGPMVLLTGYFYQKESVVNAIDIDKSSGYKVYPNPSDGICQVDLDPERQVEIKVTDIEGRLLCSKTLKTGDVIDIQNHPSGLYFLEIGGSIIRLVKQ